MNRTAVAALAALILLLPSLGQATLIYTERAAWEAAVWSYADVDIASQVSEWSTLSAGDSLALPSTTGLVFDTDLQGRQVPSSWGTWSGGESPAVLWTEGELNLTGTFSSSVYAFGLEIEPNYLGFDIALALSDGTEISQIVDSETLARFYGWTGGGISQLTISAPEGTRGFAVGRLVEGYSTPIPEPCTAALLGGGLLGLAWLKRRAMVGRMKG